MLDNNEKTTIIRAEHIRKQYPGVTALADTSISFDGGKVHALVGKNGSGKSTLIKIFSGATQQTEGKFWLDDEELRFNSPQEAFQKGIATVYQELSLVPNMTVAENIFLSNMPLLPTGLVDYKSMRANAVILLKKLGIELSPDEKVGSLSVGKQQLVEIAKATTYNPRVIQFDEPTSALSTDEIKLLFKLIRELKSKGTIILYVSHRMDEIWEIADTCSVFRDSLLIGTVPMPETPKSTVLSMMFGDVKVENRPSSKGKTDEVVLDVRHISLEEKLNDISFQLHKGEILGIAGLMGAGRTELLRTVFGADKFDSGEVYLFGKKVKKITPEIMRSMGVGMIQEDRHHDGLALKQSIKSNICMSSIMNLLKNRFIVSKQKEIALAQTQIDALETKIGGMEDPVSSLSGGNQQKVVVGRWLAIKPRILLFDEPSRGIDVNAKQQIFKVMWNESDQGIASIMVSSEVEELIEVCHRILILKDGRLIGECDPEGLTSQQLYSMCMGE